MSLEPDDHFKTWTKRIEESRLMKDRASKCLEAGKYDEAANAFVDYAVTCSEFGEASGLQCPIIEAAETLEMKNAYPEAGKLYLFTANTLRKAQLWGDAITCYRKAAEAYTSVGDKRFRVAAAACYVGAADCLVQLKLWSDAERMMTLAAILSTGENVVDLDKEAMKSFAEKDYDAASQVFGRIASVYVASLEQLSDLLPRSGLGEIAIETKSILLHRFSESRVAQAASLIASGMIQEAKKELSDAAVGFRVALMNIDPLLLVGRPSPSDYKRFSYNLMMSTVLYKLLGENDEAEEMFKHLIGNKEKRVAEKLGDIQYYKVAQDILKMRSKGAIEELSNVRMGNLEDIKDKIIEGFKTLLKQ